jgi:hypothetical protein
MLSKLFHLISFLVIFTIFVFVPVSLSAATFEFSPSNNEFKSGCVSNLDILIDTGGKESNSADIEISFDPDQIQILDSMENIDGVQIKPGNAYETYFGNVVDQAKGKILLAGGSFTTGMIGKKTFASIQFKSKEGVLRANFDIKFDGFGSTLDSNIAESDTSDDLLSQVKNGKYSFSKDVCQKDLEPPKINFLNPSAYQKSLDINSQISIQITDNLSGVDLSNTIFIINGEIYKASDFEVQSSGNSLNYTFIITLRKPLPIDAFSTIIVQTQDLSQNKSQSSIVFNLPKKDTEEIICFVESSTPPDSNNYTDQIQNLKSNKGQSLFSSESFVYRNNLTSQAIIKSLSAGRYFDTPLKTLEYFSLFALAFLILSLIGLILAFKRRVVDGVALDKNNLVIDFCMLKAIDIVTNRVVDTTETDKYGNYKFHLFPGVYNIKPKNQVDFEDKLLVPVNHITKFLGVDLNDLPEHESFNYKFLDGLEGFFFNLRLTFTKLSPGLILAGLILSINNFLLFSNFLNLLIMVGFIVEIAIFVLIPYAINVFYSSKK